MWDLILLLALAGANALTSAGSDIPPYVQARSAFTHSRFYLQQSVPQVNTTPDRLKFPYVRQKLAMGLVVAVTGSIVKNCTESGTDKHMLDVLDEYVPLAWEDYNKVSRAVNHILAEAHAKIQPITSLIDALCRTTDSVEMCNMQVDERVRSSDDYVKRRAKLILALGRVSKILAKNEQELNNVAKSFNSVPYLLQQIETRPAYKQLIRELRDVYLLLRKSTAPYDI